MLPADFPFESRGWPLRLLAFVLGEAFLGFLAIVAAALTLIPMLFSVRPHTNDLLEAGQWTIIGLFAVEYSLAFAFAPRKKAFLGNSWRLLDLLTVVVPLVTLLPQVSTLLRSSPVLRLVRLARVLTLGVRASGVVVREEVRRAAVSVSGPVEVSVLRPGKTLRPSSASWDEFLHWVREPGEQWYHVSNLNPEQLRKAALAAGLPPTYVESHFGSAGYPHLDVNRRHTALFS